MKRIKNLLVVIIMFYGNTAFPYDFSAIAPTGQTMYYNIVGGNAQVTIQQQFGGYDSNAAQYKV